MNVKTSLASLSLAYRLEGVACDEEDAAESQPANLAGLRTMLCYMEKQKGTKKPRISAGPFLENWSGR